MKLQTKATQVAQRTAYLLRAGERAGRWKQTIAEPAWFKVVAQNPPTHNLNQKLHRLEEFKNKKKGTSVGGQSSSTGLYVTRYKQKYGSNAQHLYRIKEIRYFEDKIRRFFYEQHPWELARPKLLIENNGNNAEKYDWSSIDQPFKKLDGESVVQRTLYLLKTEFKGSQDWHSAYDKARLEFYRLRMREESEMQVATEEAAMFGSVFGPSYIEHGIAAEQKVIDQWVQEASEATKAKRAKISGPVSYEEEPEEPKTEA
jgi:small subunit ribosomal protein S23